MKGEGQVELFVPGRLCLFGEHSDWAGERRAVDASIAPGGCILTGTDQGIGAAVECAECFSIESRLPDGGVRGPLRVEMEPVALRAAAADGGFFSYAAGVAAVVRERHGCGGVAIRAHRCDLPLARGLSSSAAVCVLTARAFNQVHRLGLDLRAEMELAYEGERATGSRCGRMDQACAYGSRVVELGFDGPRLEVRVLRVGGPMALLIVDLRHPKDTRRILADLHQAFEAGGAIRDALGRHNLATLATARVDLASGDAAALGALMTEAQARFDRDVAPASAELRSPRLHAVLAHPASRELAWGGKGVGSQGDGAAQLVCRGPEERAELARHLAAAGLGDCLPLTIGASA